MMDDLGSHGWSMGLGMGLWWIIGILSVVLIVWLVVRTARSTNSADSSRNTALDILKERYAKGEINKDEFEERKKDLM
jgi:putative membrane protein